MTVPLVGCGHVAAQHGLDAEERRHRRVGRLTEDARRRAHLAEPAVEQDDHAMAQRERLVALVRHPHGRRVRLGEEIAHLRREGRSGRRIERGKGFVEQD